MNVLTVLPQPQQILNYLRDECLFVAVFLSVATLLSLSLYLTGMFLTLESFGGSWTVSLRRRELLVRIGRRLTRIGWRLLGLTGVFVYAMTLLYGIMFYILK